MILYDHLGMGPGFGFSFDVYVGNAYKLRSFNHYLYEKP